MKLYNPKPFQEGNWQEVAAHFPLATLIAGNTISHLPLLLEERSEGTFLVGHLARANSQSRVLDGAECAVIFRGPDAYISPLWYEECDVPTWNYVAVHLSGKARVLGEEDALRALQKLSEKMEGEGGWEFRVPKDLEHTLHQTILAFEIRVGEIEVKSKLSQNRGEKDRKGVVAGLRKRKDARSHELANWMEAHAAPLIPRSS